MPLKRMDNVCKEMESQAECADNSKIRINATETANRLDVAHVDRVSPSPEPSITQKLAAKQYVNALLMIFVTFSGTLCYALIVPFFPDEAIRRGATQLQIGFIFAIYQFTCLLSGSVYGRYLTVVGSKFAFVSGVSCSGCAALIFGFLVYSPAGTTFLVLCLVIRAFQGMCSSATNTAIFAITAKEFPDKVSSLVGIYESVSGLAFIVGPVFGGVIYQFGGFSLPLYIVGGLILIAALLSYVLLPSHPHTATEEVPEKKASYMKLLTIPATWLPIFSIISATMIMSFLDTILAVYLDMFGLDPAQKGLMFSILSVSYMMTSVFYGRLMDRNGWSTPLMISGAIVTGCGYILIAPVPLLPIQGTLILAGFALMIIGCGISAQIIPPFKTILQIAKSHDYPDDMYTMGLVSGIVNTSLPLGGFTGSIVGGFLVQSIQFPWTITILGMTNITLALTFLACVLFAGLWSRFIKRETDNRYTPIDNENDIVPEENRQSVES